MGDRKEKPAILVPSWDGYADIWEPFFFLLRRNWPDCPYPLYLGLNEAEGDHAKVSLVRSGNDTGFCKALRIYLHQVPHDWVIVWIDDLLLNRKVESSLVGNVVRYAQEKNCAHVRLNSMPDSLVSMASAYFPSPQLPGMGHIPKDAPYRAGLTVGLWRKSVLLGLLRDEESAWDFERNAGRRSAGSDMRFLCHTAQGASPPLISVTNSIRKGLWTRPGVALLKREGFGGILANRREESASRRIYLLKLKKVVKVLGYRMLFHFRYKLLRRGAQDSL